MVFDRLRADEEPVADLGIRRAVAEQLQYLVLSSGQCTSDMGAWPAARPQLAQERGGPVRVRSGPEPLESAVRSLTPR